ncbi:MAG: mitochondrial fission ELM1 family protein [Filomicrobium sp.]
MNTDATEPANEPDGPLLEGASAWIITDGRAGMVVQARGVADALKLDYEEKIVAPKGIWKLMAPWGPVNPNERLGQPDSNFPEPWPDVVIASGRASIPYIRAIGRKAGPRTYTIVLQDPRSGENTADVIWVPEHDRRRGPNVITTPTSPHSFSQERLAELRKTVPPDIAALPSPRIAVSLGGRNGLYKFTDADEDRLSASLSSLAELGASFMITPSRRSHESLVEAADRATKGAPRILWRGEGENPYGNFLAHADALIVTADSVNMCGEACATGRPVYIFMPSGDAPKFQRFHDALAATGAPRPLPERFTELETWAYQPLDGAKAIAAEIERRYARRKHMLSGLCR